MSGLAGAQPSDLIVILVVAELLELVAMVVVSTMLPCVPGRALMLGSKLVKPGSTL